MTHLSTCDLALEVEYPIMTCPICEYADTKVCSTPGFIHCNHCHFEWNPDI